MNCRHCGSPLHQQLVHLGSPPPSNAYRLPGSAEPEPHYPLRILVCLECWLVQTEDYLAPRELFTADYAYFSSTSRTWLAHAAAYTEMIVDRLGLSAGSRVVEVACNDGYLLRNFVSRGIPCQGIEPAADAALAATALGIPVVTEFLDRELAQRLVAERGPADLVIANNVYAHVPDINGFTAALRTLLRPDGVLTVEFPHLLQLIEQCQFDTIYHEHFSYLSLRTVQRIMASAGLRVFDVEELATHGGSLRVYACPTAGPHTITEAVRRVISRESAAGLTTAACYADFQARADARRDALLAFLHQERAAGRTVVGYGAAAKGNTLLNFAGVSADLLAAVADEAAAKQGKLLPGSRIPVVAPARLVDYKPDWVLILPWNLATEIDRCVTELGLSAGTVVAMPELRVVRER